jgi:hypothetical protein
MKVRKVKTVSFTFGEVSNIEERVNRAVEELAAENKKVVSITTNSFGLSPMTLIYTIIYEETVKPDIKKSCEEDELSDFS